MPSATDRLRAALDPAGYLRVVALADGPSLLVDAGSGVPFGVVVALKDYLDWTAPAMREAPAPHLDLAPGPVAQSPHHEAGEGADGGDEARAPPAPAADREIGFSRFEPLVRRIAVRYEADRRDVEGSD